MTSRIETLNTHGYRSDGRRQYELRDFTVDLSERGQADGCASVRWGLTEVLVEVFGPRESKIRRETIHDRAVINVELNMVSFSSGERRKRGRGDKRVLELAATIKSTFEPIIQTSLYPRSTIDIYVHILQQDGSILPTSINATTLALITAGIPLTDFICSISAGVHNTSSLLDLTTLEENDVPHLVIAVLPRTGKVSLVSLESRLHVERFEELMRVACEAGGVLWKEMKGAVEDRTKKLVNAMEVAGGTHGKVDRDVMMDMNDY